jgi:hypothetical protein
MPSPSCQFAARQGFDALACVHDHYAVAKLGDNRKIVRYQQEGKPTFLCEVL